MIGNNIFKDIFLILCARRKANAFRMQQNERLTPFRCKKLANNIFELLRCSSIFKNSFWVFFSPKLFFYPLKPPWNLSSVTDLEKSMPLEVSARKITEKKNMVKNLCKNLKNLWNQRREADPTRFLVHFLVIPENHMGIPYTSGHRWYRPYRKITKIIFPLLAGSRSYKIFGPLKNY